MQRGNHRLSAITHVQAAEDDVDVPLDRTFRNAESIRNLLVAQSFQNKPQYFYFPAAELWSGWALLKGFAHLRRQVADAGVDRPNRLQQLTVGHSLQQISHRARPQRFLNFCVALIGGEDDKPALR